MLRSQRFRWLARAAALRRCWSSHRAIAMAALHGCRGNTASSSRRTSGTAGEELRASLLAQLGALDATAHAAGVVLRHVKPRGVLYNRVAADPGLAKLIADSVRSVSPELVLVGRAGSALLAAGRAAGLAVAAEAFADRAYEADGCLRSRRQPDAVHHDPAVAAEQARSIAIDGRVRAHDGTWIDVQADTLCIHGDSPGAPIIAAAVRTALTDAGLTLAPLGGPR